MASIDWHTAKLFYQACLGREVEKTSAYVAQLEDILGRLFSIVGQQWHIDGAYDKMFSKIADPQFPLRLLPPYGYAKEESFVEFVRYVRDTHPQWSAAETKN